MRSVSARRLSSFLLVALSALLLASPAGAARAPVVELATMNVAPGDAASLGVQAPAHSASCALTVRSPHGRSATAGKARPGTTPHLLWSWHVGRTAAAGTWRARVACTVARHRRSTHVAIVVRGGSRSGALIARGTLKLQATRHAQLGKPAASGGESAGEGAGGNPFDYGQCTYYAYERRGDIVETAAAKGIPRGGSVSGEWIPAAGRNAYVWDAYRWTANAQRAGIPTGTRPVPGAIVVFPRGYGGSAVGHVAYVESVNGDGTFFVTERNWNWNPSVTRRKVTPVAGITYIYGGPAGNPGGSTPASTPAPAGPPSVAITAPGAEATVSGTVHVTANAANVSAVRFTAYYATDPGNVATVGWHVIGTDTNGADGWSTDWDTRSIPDQGNGGWGTVNLAAIAVVGSAETGTRDYHRVTVSNAGAPATPAPAVNRTAVASYDRMAPGAPHNGYFNVAWQAFTAQSNTITQLAATVGTGGAAAGVAVPYNLTLRLCTTSDCGSVLAEAHPQIVNYGATIADIGDVAVQPGQTYYVVWYQPGAANGATWVTYWWAGGSGISSSDQMQAFVRGYNR